MSHWLRNLPDIGDAGLKLAEQVEAAHRRADETEELLDSVLNTVTDQERIALEFAKQRFSPEEIEQAHKQRRSS